MSRATSYNFELEVDGQTLHPLEIGVFNEGAEGRIKIQDGCLIYNTRDEIVTTPEIEITVLIQRNREYYFILKQWHNSKAIKDVFLIGRDSAGVARTTYLLTNCECAMGEKNSFNRKSKTEDTKKYFLIPEYIEEVLM